MSDAQIRECLAWWASRPSAYFEVSVEEHIQPYMAGLITAAAGGELMTKEEVGLALVAALPSAAVRKVCCRRGEVPPSARVVRKIAASLGLELEEE